MFCLKPVTTGNTVLCTIFGDFPCWKESQSLGFSHLYRCSVEGNQGAEQKRHFIQSNEFKMNFSQQVLLSSSEPCPSGLLW